jgi:hypothetical protein
VNESQKDVLIGTLVAVAVAAILVALRPYLPGTQTDPAKVVICPSAEPERAKPSGTDCGGSCASCSAGMCRRPMRPFNVVCPNCRESMTVTPPTMGQVGQVLKTDKK